MAAERTRYTDEYRQETADYTIASGRPITEIARELELNPKTLNRWVVARRPGLTPLLLTQTVSFMQRSAQPHKLSRILAETCSRAHCECAACCRTTRYTRISRERLRLSFCRS